MTKPLALVLYERLLPGTQIVNRLQDLNYRVQTIADAGMLVTRALETAPLVVLAELQADRPDILAAINSLRENPETAHIPVIAIGDEQLSLGAQGVTLFASESAVLSQLPQLLEQALQIE
jgi:CheY-like chemotaxis protein